MPLLDTLNAGRKKKKTDKEKRKKRKKREKRSTINQLPRKASTLPNN